MGEYLHGKGLVLEESFYSYTRLQKILLDKVVLPNRRKWILIVLSDTNRDQQEIMSSYAVTDPAYQYSTIELILFDSQALIVCHHY